MKLQMLPPPAGPSARLCSTKTLRSVVLACAAAVAAPVYAADITLSKAFLDSVGGFVNFAKPTLGSGSLAITNNLQPGDTVYIEAHTRPYLTLVNLTQGTAANPITVTNTGGQFIIDYADGFTGNTGIGLWGAQHVHFRGTPGTGYDYGIKVNRTKNTAVKVDYNQYQQGRVGGTFGNSVDVEISHIQIGNAGFAGIMAKYEITTANVPAGYTALLDGLRIHDCYIHDVHGEAMYLGWTSSGRPDIANVHVYDNLIVNSGWDGIQLNRSRGTNVIENNQILGYGGTSHEWPNGPYYWQSSAFSIGHNDNLRISHNYTKADNAYSGSALTLFFIDNTEISNNVFVHGTYGGSTLQTSMYVNQVFRNLPGVTLKIVNNTLVEPENHGIHFATEDNLDNTTGQPIDEGGITVPVTFANNIIAAPIYGQYVIYPTASTVTGTTNLLVSTLAGAGFVNSSSDFHLAAGSPAIDAGTTVASVTDDHEYTSRPQGSAYDIGAYEYVGSGPTIGIIAPVGVGTATGSDYCPASGAFNEPPAWNSTTGEPTGVSTSPHTSTTTAYSNRFWYIDLGADWAKIRITEMWTRYRPYSGGSHNGYAVMWWDNDPDITNDGITAATLNFGAGQNVPHVGNQVWIQDRDFSSAPITPQGRYLVVSNGATIGDRPNEFAFIGYTVP